MARLQLSENFYLDEFTRSQYAERHGIDMRVRADSPVVENLRRLCRVILQPLRNCLGPVYISSGYRPLELNRKLHSSDSSAHIDGRAADLVVSGRLPLEVTRWIEANLPHYDQLIHEFGRWAHVAVPRLGESPRREELTSIKHGPRSRTVYVRGLMRIDAALERVA